MRASLMQPDRDQRLRRSRSRTVNGTGSASANTLLMKSMFRMGIPVMGQELLPVEHPGPAHLVRDPRHARTATSRAPARVDIMVAMNAETYAQRRARGQRPAAFCIYDSTWPRPALLTRDDITVLGVPLAKHVQRELRRGAHAHPDEEHLLRGRAGGAARARPGEDPRSCSAETYAKKPALRRLEQEGHRAGLQLRAASTSRARCRCAWRALDKTAGHIMIDGNTAAALGCVLRRRHRRRVVSDHAVDVGDGRASSGSARR